MIDSASLASLNQAQQQKCRKFMTGHAATCVKNQQCADERLLALPHHRRITAIGQGCLAAATGFLLWVQHTAVPNMYLHRFMKYVIREPISIIPCIFALIIYWLTAQWLVPQRDSSQYSRL
jgi:hypothetical protein